MLPTAPEPVPVTVDLLVPDPTAPPAKAKRAIDVPPHGTYAARTRCPKMRKVDTRKDGIGFDKALRRDGSIGYSP